MAIAGQKILIRAAHCTVQQFVANRAPVDNKILFLRCSVIESGQTSKSVEPQCVALGMHRHGIFAKLPAHNG